MNVFYKMEDQLAALFNRVFLTRYRAGPLYKETIPNAFIWHVSRADNSLVDNRGGERMVKGEGKRIIRAARTKRRLISP